MSSIADTLINIATAVVLGLIFIAGIFGVQQLGAFLTAYGIDPVTTQLAMAAAVIVVWRSK